MSEKDQGDRRRRIESVIPELIKRAVEIGVEKAVEAPDSLKELVGGIKLPRELAHYVLAQVEETKSGIVRVVAKEVGDFLDRTNVSGELQKMLSTMQLEVRTVIRFRPIEQGGERDRIKPDVSSDVRIRKARAAERAESPDAGAAAAEDRSRDRRRARD